MEFAARLKEKRTEHGISQEDLAERIFVSRQTISNWETDRTYPDIQSLLLLSDFFDTSIDELVKGDVEAMEEAVENDWKTMSRLAAGAWVLVGIGIACLIIGFVMPTGPSSIIHKLSEGEVLSLVVFFALWVIGMVMLGIVEYLKKKNDLVTYRDIVAYSHGEKPPRDNSQFSRKHSLATAFIKLAFGAICGAIVGIVLVQLFR